MPMPAGNDLPNLSSNHCANLFGWREAPELAEYLRQLDIGPENADPLEILAAPGFWKTLQMFDQDYDFVLFDSTPLLAALGRPA